jgi:hypothetical protein
MVKRRSLADGLSTTPKADPEKEKRFVYEANKPKAEAALKPAKPKPQPERQAPATAPQEKESQPGKPTLGRSPLTTRLRSDIGTALKRASLERELAGQSPHTVQDILEEALEPWLKERGYLK